MGRFLWFLLLAGVGVWAVWLDALVARDVVSRFWQRPYDFLTFWTAARVPGEAVYDIHAITESQYSVIRSGTSARPFPYPPTFLFWLWPFGKFDFATALIAWLALGISLYAAACWRLIGKLWPLALISPAIAFCAVTGQVTFLMAAALIMGVVWLPGRPILAGVLLGAAATIKPQVLALVPLALIVGKHWRPLLAAVCSGGLIGAASVIVHGDMWLRWLRSLGEFRALIQTQHWDEKISATPAGMLEAWGVLTPALHLLVYVAGWLIAIALVVYAFRRAGTVERYGALALGYLLVSPYALWYELVLLQPLAVWMLFNNNWGRRAAGLVAFLFFPKAIGVLAMAATLPEWPRLRRPAPVAAPQT